MLSAKLGRFYRNCKRLNDNIIAAVLCKWAKVMVTKKTPEKKKSLIYREEVNKGHVKSNVRKACECGKDVGCIHCLCLTKKSSAFSQTKVVLFFFNRALNELLGREMKKQETNRKKYLLLSQSHQYLDRPTD